MDSTQIHRLMLGIKFSFRLAWRLPDNTFIDKSSQSRGYYVKDYSTEVGIISIALLLKEDPVISLPTAVILTLPEQLKGILIPHVSIEGYLCYVEQKESDWDPNSPEQLYQQIDERIETTLNKAVLAAASKAFDDAELEGEFSSYWRSSSDLYMLSSVGLKSSLKSRMYSFTNSDGLEKKEFVCYSDDKNDDKIRKVLEKWLCQREVNQSSITDDITTFCIKVNPKQLAGVTWPPDSLKSILCWLSKVDHNARNKLVEKIVLSGTKKQLVIFDVLNHDLLGFFIEFNIKAINFSRFKRKGKSRINLRDLLLLLSSDRVSNNYYRIGVEKADVESMFSRNLMRGDNLPLNGLRIALVGCGTIGGYLSELLIQSGAGCDTSEFHLYDNDIYKPHNFSRHTLPAKYFGNSKALSLAELLIESMHFVANVRGFKMDFLLNKYNLSKYDIIIDATGRPPVSKRLAMLKRTLNNKASPLIVHAFNDGNGRASKVFIDSGSCCYGCLISDTGRYKNETDLRFLDKGYEIEKKRSCGSTYTPYDAAVSHVTASLTQEALLNQLTGNGRLNYYEHMFDGSRSFRPYSVKKNEKCRICGCE